MSADSFARIKPELLYGPFFLMLEDLMSACERAGAYYVATCGLRSYEEQNKLYAVGRTMGTPGHFVTKARPGQSLHNFAIAVDFCRDVDPSKPGLQPVYEDSAYAVLASEAEKLGLEAGLYWEEFQDAPHIQLPIKAHGLTLADLRAAYDRHNMGGVFALLDRYEWNTACS